MGDRCYMTITVGGDISDLDDLDALVEAIAEDKGYYGDDKKMVRRDIIAALAKGEQLYFEFSEINHAELDCYNTACILKLDALAHNDSGDNYDAGNQSHNGVTGEVYQWDDATEGTIGIDVIKTIIATHHPADKAINKIMETLDAESKSEWSDLRPFTVSGAAADSLAAEVARHKIEKAA